jgi:hypothetical protein
MAVSINHDMDQGSNFSFLILAKDTTGNAINLSSGYTASCQMRKFYTSTSAVNLNASITGGTGYILVSLSATGTAAVKAGTWFYDVELQSDNGSTVQRLVQGMIYVHPEITKS